jgi:hypothetical protein
MGQINFPDGSTVYVRNSTALNKVFDPTGKVFSAGGFYAIDSSGAETQIATSTGLTYSEGKAIRFGSCVTGASTSSNITNYGISSVNISTGIGEKVYTLNPPDIGVSKTLYAYTANTSDYPVIYTGSTAITIRDGTTALGTLLRVQLKNNYASVTMVGITTSAWLLTSHEGAVTFTT